MSRMLGFVSAHPGTPAELIGDRLLNEFLALSALHADGWGFARHVASGSRPEVTAGLAPIRDEWMPTTTHAGVVYLRFASAGSAVARENLQPFVYGSTAFAHNGSLMPRETGEQALRVDERAALLGTTDSEVYFALLRRSLSSPDTSAATAVARGVAQVRLLYPTACLNAMLLVDGDLVVVHSPGAVEPPLHAFEARGVTGGDLPRGHDAGYNVLATTVLPSGARIVATSGVDTSTWDALSDDTVFLFTRDGTVRSAPIAEPR